MDSAASNLDDAEILIPPPGRMGMNQLFGNSNGRAQLLFVTGCYRSGTTLLEKLLHSHPQVCIGSQPFPILYFHAKEQFLKQRNLQRRYPLDHLFLDDDYGMADFVKFLETHDVSQDDISDIFDRLADYKLGSLTPGVFGLRDRVTPARFARVYRQLHELLAELLSKPDSDYIGSKEVLCEEYIPFLLAQGAKVVVSVRDPRDMITSLDFRERDNQTGDHRPLLFSLRAWRKSVAFVLTFDAHENFLWLRYEDLVTDPDSVLVRIAKFLNIESYAEEIVHGELRGQNGQPWKGNSSFSDFNRISSASVGKFRNVLPPDALDYIETCCRPEMTRLDYQLCSVKAPNAASLRDYREPFENVHAKFPADYSYAGRRVTDELTRLDMLKDGSGSIESDTAEKWFLSQRACLELCNAYDQCRTTQS